MINIINITLLKMLLSAHLGNALKSWIPSSDDINVITCNDYIPFNFDSKQICLSMQNLNIDNKCKIILPSSIQINFNDFSFNDNNVLLTVSQGNEERYTDSWTLDEIKPTTSPIFYLKNVELSVTTTDSKGIVCFTIENVFPLKKSNYHHFRFLRV